MRCSGAPTATQQADLRLLRWRRAGLTRGRLDAPQTTARERPQRIHSPMAQTAKCPKDGQVPEGPARCPRDQALKTRTATQTHPGTVCRPQVVVRAFNLHLIEFRRPTADGTDSYTNPQTDCFTIHLIEFVAAK